MVESHNMRWQPRRIGLVFAYSLGYYRDILRGIKAFAESRPSWIFTPIDPAPSAVTSLRALDHDGLIAHIFDHALADALLAYGKPVINVSGVLPELPIPRIGVNHLQVGALAASYLLDLGLRHFAFVGYPNHAFSTGRERGFRRTIARAGFTVERFLECDSTRWESKGLWRWNDAMERWLITLPRPVGLFASHDLQGVQVSEVCRRSGLRVPEDVAIVGVDNDDLLCDLARPSLSSVALPAERMGFEAARLLDRLMARPSFHAKRRAILLPPVAVVSRRSSDYLAIDDPELASAVRYIREHGHRPLQVNDVLHVVPISRRSLERKFRSVLGRGVWEEIRRVHMERARSLLSSTDLPMSDVATHAGFSDSKQLSVVFRQETGMTPTAYRRQFRARS